MPLSVLYHDGKMAKFDNIVVINVLEEVAIRVLLKKVVVKFVEAYKNLETNNGVVSNESGEGEYF